MTKTATPLDKSAMMATTIMTSIKVTPAVRWRFANCPYGSGASVVPVTPPEPAWERALCSAVCRLSRMLSFECLMLVRPL
jgi:hypothetical protein